MEITPAGVSAGAAVVTVISTVAGLVVRDAFASRDAQIESVKKTQKLLFEKLDKQEATISEHRLHTAETYVNRDMLREALAPITKALEEIKDDLREDRKNK